MKDGAPQAFICDASRNYIDAGIPLVVLGGKEYGSGSSRDWAAKGTALLGVRAVIVESYERIHRSNLIGMGVLPLQFPAGETAESLGLDGTETFGIPLGPAQQPLQPVGRPVPDVFGQLPGVLPRHVGQQPAHQISERGPRLGTGEQRAGDPLGQQVKVRLPARQVIVGDVVGHVINELARSRVRRSANVVPDASVDERAVDVEEGMSKPAATVGRFLLAQVALLGWRGLLGQGEYPAVARSELADLVADADADRSAEALGHGVHG
jgi:hypothetical protein